MPPNARPPSVDASLLVSGFEPFGGDRVNPSQDVALALDGQRVGGRRVVAVVLPCTFAGAWPALHAAIERERPAVVLALGVAADRAAFCAEVLAVNRDDARLPDNAGVTRCGVPVQPDGPPVLQTGLPTDAIVAAWQAAGLPAQRSTSAGGFVCNHLFYQLLRGLGGGPATSRRVAGDPAAARPPAGFVHLPAYPPQAARRGLTGASLPAMRRAAAIALQVTLASLAGRTA